MKNNNNSFFNSNYI